jgi:hypothetical protein
VADGDVAGLMLAGEPRRDDLRALKSLCHVLALVYVNDVPAAV